jgi:hypothetical protein
MAIPEACGLWIDQRIEEELEANPDAPNLSAIGRRVAAEVERHFEVRVNPETVRSRARRVTARSNDQGNESPTNPNSKPNLEKLEKPKHGGARPGAGRKPKAALPLKPPPETANPAPPAVGRYTKPIANEPRRRKNQRPLPDINDFVVEVAGDLDIMSNKLERIVGSMDLISNMQSRRIYCGAVKRFEEYYNKAKSACEGMGYGKTD